MSGSFPERVEVAPIVNQARREPRTVRSRRLASTVGWYVVLINTDAPILMFLLPNVLMGLGNAGMWGPLAATATRNLEPRLAGAGSGVYNTLRTIGLVLGSASIAAIMQSSIVANMPVSESGEQVAVSFGQGQLPPGIAEPFAAAMAQSLIIPALVVGIGGLLLLFLKPAKRAANKPAVRGSARSGAQLRGKSEPRRTR